MLPQALATSGCLSPVPPEPLDISVSVWTTLYDGLTLFGPHAQLCPPNQASPHWSVIDSRVRVMPWDPREECHYRDTFHHTYIYALGTGQWGFPGGSVGKESAYNAGDLGDPWIRKVPWRRKCQYSCLGNPMDRAVCRATVHGVTRIWHYLATKPLPGTGQCAFNSCRISTAVACSIFTHLRCTVGQRG